MTDRELQELRPHPRTGDEANVSYRAKHIRALFAEIDRLTARLAQPEPDAGVEDWQVAFLRVVRDVNETWNDGEQVRHDDEITLRHLRAALRARSAGATVEVAKRSLTTDEQRLVMGALRASGEHVEDIAASPSPTVRGRGGS